MFRSFRRPVLYVRTGTVYTVPVLYVRTGTVYTVPVNNVLYEKIVIFGILKQGGPTI